MASHTTTPNTQGMGVTEEYETLIHKWRRRTEISGTLTLVGILTMGYGATTATPVLLFAGGLIAFLGGGCATLSMVAWLYAYRHAALIGVRSPEDLHR